MRPIAFGTDGWRAVVGDDFTYEAVRFVAQAVAWYLETDSRPVVVGHDTRYCGQLFAREVARVLAANGKDVIFLEGYAATPVQTWTVVDRKAAGGVVVTASHNPMQYNGLKYKPDFGGSAPPEVVGELEKLSLRAQSEGVKQISWEESLESGRVHLYDPMPSYIQQIGKMVDLEAIRNAGLRIVHEAMYGAGTGVIQRIVEGGKTTVTALHGEANPSFGGMHPEPIDKYMPEALAVMRQGGHDICIANDGDADRVGIIDEKGRYVNQLQVMALLAMYLLEERGERGDIVRSITETNMVDALAEKFGVSVHEEPVGFKYIGKKMLATKAILGGEESGGFAFRGHIPERDGILAGLMIAESLVKYGMTVSGLVARLQEVVGPRAYDRHDIRFDREGYAQRKQAVYELMLENSPREIAGTRVVNSRTDDGFKFYLEDGAWVLIRMSGTEPLMRIYSEAATQQRVEELISALEEHVGVRQNQAVGAAH